MKKVIIPLFLLLLLLSATPASAYSIDKLVIKVNEDGSADVACTYSLSWWEYFYLWVIGIFGDKGEEIKKRIENNFQREVSSFSLEKDTAKFKLEDYTGKVKREDGTWYYTKFFLSDDACKKINLGNVSVVFPDGFVYNFVGELPNIKHLNDENLAELWLEAKYTKETYKEIEPLYFAKTYHVRAIGKFIEKIYLKMIDLTVGLPIDYPVKEFIDLTNELVHLRDTMKEYKETLDYAVGMEELAGSYLSPSIRSEYLPMIGWHIRDIVKLKEEEMDLIYSLVSDDKMSQESRELLIGKLIKNLEDQEEKLNTNSRSWSACCT